MPGGRGGRYHKSYCWGGEPTYAILIPVSSKATQQRRCFSRPLFRTVNLPEPLRTLRRHELLLELKARPGVWKCVIQLYPGSQVMWERHCSASTPIRKAPFVGGSGGSRGDEASVVREAPGLQATLREYFEAGESAKKRSIEASARRSPFEDDISVLTGGGNLSPPRGMQRSRGVDTASNDSFGSPWAAVSCHPNDLEREELQGAGGDSLAPCSPGMPPTPPRPMPPQCLWCRLGVMAVQSDALLQR